MAADNNHAYTWDTENKLTGIDSGGSSGICIVYDALGRAVEQAKGSACTTSPTSSMEIVYSPSGAKLALMNGSALTKAFVPLPGGVTAVYNTSGLQYYRHPDWLGSSRLATTTSRTKYYDVAYAPFGEPYAGSGTQDLSFTGQNQDTESGNVPGGAGGLYDFLYREHTPVQGRWLSPDPSGLAAANPSDPQTWNRYAYVGNRPLSATDSSGLDVMECDPSDPSCGPGGGGYCPPEFENCDPGCDPVFGCGSGGGPGGPPITGGGNPPAPPQRTGGVWPGNETTGLPGGLNTSPLGLGGLLGLLPCAGGSTGLGFTTSTSVQPPTNPCPVLLVVIPAIVALSGGNSSQSSSAPNSPTYGAGTCYAVPQLQLRHYGGCKYACIFVYSDPFDVTIGEVTSTGAAIDAACGPGKFCPAVIVVEKEHPGAMEPVKILSCTM